MKKIIDREYIKDNGRRYLGLTVKNIYGKMYAVVAFDGTVIVTGKELKGYVDDIIYFQWDGVVDWTGNYYLKSDRHGVICKWKGNDPYITLDADNYDFGTLYFPDGTKWKGYYYDLVGKYYGFDAKYQRGKVEVIA